MSDWIDSASWKDILEGLRRGSIPADLAAKAIVRLGKPLDPQKIRAAKDIVEKYLTHENPWVRHEALWFLGSWGRQRESKPHIVNALTRDASEDNRAYAAACLGVLEWGTNDAAVLRALKAVILDDRESESVRVKAYGAMLKVTGRRIEPKELFDYEMGDKGLCDIDWQWVTSVS